MENVLNAYRAGNLSEDEQTLILKKCEEKAAVIRPGLEKANHLLEQLSWAAIGLVKQWTLRSNRRKEQREEGEAEHLLDGIIGA